MAVQTSNFQPVEACCVDEPEQSPVTTAQDPPSNNQGNEPEYDFVEQPDKDCFCPVSLELLTEPYLTSCCGHHISQQAANRLIRERKPCPMCKEENLTGQVDKYFKRKVINTLKVRCPHKKNGCEWVGELGDHNNHSTSCPKRPWKCQYCDLKTTFDVGLNEHTPNCTQYPLPCPNQCEIGTVLRCDAEKHLLVCPLQLVGCEFASYGCEVKIPRRDLTRHMTENAQHHLMSATLLNLRLTRELHQKMEEKDQQIAELKQQLNEHAKDLDTKLQQQTKDFDTKLQQTVQVQTGIAEKLSTIELQTGLTWHEFTLAQFKKQQANDLEGNWYSNNFYSSPGGYKFQLNICTNGHGEAHGTHLSAYLFLRSGNYDKKLQWPFKGTLYLELLNQRGDHNHYMCITTVEHKKENSGISIIGQKFYSLAGLTYNAQNDTEYLRYDCIKFRLRLITNILS